MGLTMTLDDGAVEVTIERLVLVVGDVAMAVVVDGVVTDEIVAVGAEVVVEVVTEVVTALVVDFSPFL